jgi:fatty acid desaturase
VLATTVLYNLAPPAAFVLLVLALTLHSSLQHEVLHGHPFADPRLNELLVALPIGLVYPFRRFRDLHLAHHRDETLTDPYDDPESNFMCPKVWARMGRVQRIVLRANNALLGRMLLGPAIGTFAFLRAEIALVRAGRRDVMFAWCLHAAGIVAVVLWIAAAPVPAWVYLSAAYLALSILKIRTFLEHRAHDIARGRTVIVEGRGLLPFLFLNNNFHVVHHAKPRLPWYRLPAAYRQGRDEWLRRNEGYMYTSYWQVFRSHFVTPKDPVPHPLRPAE